MAIVEGINLVLPADFLLSDRTKVQVVRPQQTVVQMQTGGRLTRTWTERSLTEWDIQLLPITGDGSSDDDAVLKFNAWLQNIGRTGNQFWVTHPISKSQVVECSPITDGSRTTFCLPVYNISPLNEPTEVFVDGVPQASSGYTLHGAANMLDDVTASMTDKDQWVNQNAGNHYNSKNNPFATYGSVLYTPSSATVVSYPVGYFDCDPSSDYTSVVFLLQHGVQSRQCYAKMWEYDATPTYITNTNGSAVQVDQGVWTKLHNTQTVGAGTYNLRPGFLRNNVSSEDVSLGASALCPGDYDEWWLPSQAPTLIEFDSAPAAGSRVTAVATGYKLTKVQMLDMDWGYAWNEGYRTPTRIRAREVSIR